MGRCITYLLSFVSITNISIKHYMEGLLDKNKKKEKNKQKTKNKHCLKDCIE